MSHTHTDGTRRVHPRGRTAERPLLSRRRTLSHSQLVPLTAALLLGACDDAVGPPISRPDAPRPSLALAVGAPVDLGTLPGGADSWARGVSSFGRAAGYAAVGGGHAHAVYWPAPGAAVDLGTLPGGLDSQASGIADVVITCPTLCPFQLRAWIVGWSQTVTAQGRTVTHAFLWRPGSGMTDLGTLGGDNSYAAGVTPTGLVFGASDIPYSVTSHAFVWTPTRGMVDINPTSAVESAAANGGAAGDVVGYADFLPVGWRGVRWTAGTPMTLDPAPGQDRSFGKDVNALGVAVGWGADRLGVQHALVWGASATPTDLGTLPHFTHSLAWGVNNLAWVVGESFGPGGAAYVWTSGTGMMQLAALAGPTGVSAAYGINDAGQVVGVSDAPGGGRHATMWRVQLLGGGECTELCIAPAMP